MQRLTASFSKNSNNMPMAPEVLSSLIAGGSALAGNIFNVSATGKMNKKTMKWSEKMYHQQRQDALSDYHMQNQYNSPQNQMKMFMNAGLNPNLIYKQSQEAAPVRSAEQQMPRFQAPSVDLSGIGMAMGQYFDARLKEAQIDNVKAATDVSKMEQSVKAAQMAATLQNTKTSEFNLKLAEDLRTTSLETAKANLRKIETDINVTLNQDERAAALNSQTIKESLERILSIRAQRAKTDTERSQILSAIKNLEKDTELKQIDINLRKEGVNPSDPAWMRIIIQQLGEKLKTAKDFGGYLYEKYLK